MMVYLCTFEESPEEITHAIENYFIASWIAKFSIQCTAQQEELNSITKPDSVTCIQFEVYVINYPRTKLWV